MSRPADSPTAAASPADPPRGEYQTTPVPSTGMPRGIPYIVGNEAAERFSYYGMMGILFTFLTKHLIDVSGQPAAMSANQANEWIHNFIAAVYATPLIGAVISDWLLGKYRTIVSISLLYCVGHAVLAVMDYPHITNIEPRWMLALGLTMIAFGAGGIKPCVTAHVGDQFGKMNEHLIPKVFSWFYFSINVGATCSMLLTPWLLANVTPAWAFGVPGILMALATFVFWLGRYKFVHIPPGGEGFLKESISRDGLRAIANLIPLYLFILPFFALFDQTHSSWVDQAEHMNRNVFGWEILADQLQAMNPILVVILIPIVTYVIYPLIGTCFVVTPLRRVGIGLFITAASFAIIALAQQLIDAGRTPHLTWQIVAYIVITTAEVMVSITALEFSYTQAPKKMKSLLMGVFFFFSMTLGNLFTARVNSYIEDQKELGLEFLKGANYFWFFTVVMFVTAVVFVVWSQFYRGQTYIQGEN